MAPRFHFPASTSTNERSLASALGLVARRLGQAAVELLAPPACAACMHRLRRPAAFCEACAATVMAPEHTPFRAPGAPPTLALAAYGGALATAIERMKYKQCSDVGRTLGKLLAQLEVGDERAGELLVPVPLHPRKLADRGFNQATLLARSLRAELCPRPQLVTGALLRRRDTPAQARLTAGERLTNLRGAFSVAAPRKIAGRRVLLIDDVATTGATLAACRVALDEVGAGAVRAMVLARTPLSVGADAS